MAESRAYKKLKRAFPKAHWQRFESWTGIGVFDSNACYNGREIWIEFKEVIPPKHLNDAWIVKPKVRASQIAWQALKEKAGGITYVAVMVGPAMYVIDGQYISQLRDGMTLKAIKGLNISLEKLL
jgi:hypothetical protein